MLASQTLRWDVSTAAPRRSTNRSAMPTLAEVLARETRTGELFGVLPDGRLQCYACGHCCPLPDGAVGVCKVRFNQGGQLQVPWGYVGGVQCDPIEKKPFFHAYPGALAYSFGMLGCDLHCGYCQNWVTSQALRDPEAVAPPMLADADRSRRDALRQRARVMVSTYNEPLITSEWAVAVFKEAKRAGLIDRLRLQRQRHAAGPRVSPPVGRSLQGRSQELRRPPLPRARRTPRADPRHHPHACTRWASGSRSSRCSSPASTTRATS